MFNRYYIQVMNAMQLIFTNCNLYESKKNKKSSRKKNQFEETLSKN